MMTVYSYTRLIVYDAAFELRPDILESYESRQDREFTFRLRAGHRWSDGHPFTTEDFRFFWEDIANNKDLSPSGPPVELLVDGKPPTVEIVDERTIRYGWDAPNPYFIQSQARAAPLFLFAPAHYLKKFHPRYAEAAGTAETAGAAKGGQRDGDWVQMFRRVDVMLVNDNVDLPSLNPWILATPPPAQRYVFVRNPYYHRIDEKGQQLPYADRVIFAVTSPNLIAAKAALGEADLQLRYLKMRDYAFLQNGARSSGVSVRLWQLGSGSQLALYPNLNANDAGWRGLFRDVRFRRALSMAIDRDELNQVVYLGLATPSNNTVMSRSALFRPEYATRWATYDPGASEQASRRDRPRQARCGGDTPAARWACRARRGREPERGVRGRRRAASDRRQLEEDRHQNAGQAADARELLAAHRLRRGHDDGLCRRVQRGADARHQPAGVRAGHAGPACNGSSGACTSSPGACRARSATCRKPAGFSTTSRSGSTPPARPAGARRGTRSCRPTPSRSSPSAP